MVNNLVGITSGLYEVQTEGSLYLIDYDKKLAQRAPGEDASNLRRDGQWFSFMTAVAEIGGPMFIWSSGIAMGTDVITDRRTTNVKSIKLLSE